MSKTFVHCEREAQKMDGVSVRLGTVEESTNVIPFGKLPEYQGVPCLQW
jgi:hypothetical protein